MVGNLGHFFLIMNGIVVVYLNVAKNVEIWFKKVMKITNNNIVVSTNDQWHVLESALSRCVIHIDITHL